MVVIGLNILTFAMMFASAAIWGSKKRWSLTILYSFCALGFLFSALLNIHTEITNARIEERQKILDEIYIDGS